MAKKPTFMSYFGGKARFQDFIVPVIPKDIKKYCEPFAGSFAIYFLADFKDDVEIIFNDLNKDQANVFACSKEHKKYLDTIKYHLEDPNGKLYCKETEFEPRKAFYKELYYSYKKSNFANESFNIPDFDRASQYIYLSTAAFNSCHFTAAGFSGFNKERMKLQTFIRKLENVELQKKLEKIDIIECTGFKELIEMYDSKDTFFYLDPPYYEEKDKRSGWYGTKDDFGQQEHIDLLKMLQNTKARWALSYYDFPALSEYLPKDEYVWIEKDFFRSSASFSENKSTKGRELLILNYKPDVDLISGDDNPKIEEEVKIGVGGTKEKIKNVVDNIDRIPEQKETILVEHMSKEDVDIVREKIEEGEKSGIAEDFDKDKFLEEIKNNKTLADVKVSVKWVKKNILQIDEDEKLMEQVLKESPSTIPKIENDDEDIDDFWLE